MEKASEVLTREQILTATEETLRRFGVGKTSVTDVAKVLGVSHGTLYRHFKSKADLLEGATESWLTDKIIEPLTAVCSDTSLNGSAHLYQYIRTLIELKRASAREDEELFRVYAKVTEEAADLIGRHIRHITDQLSEIITRANPACASPGRLASAIFYATARFHHPAHAYAWKSPSIDEEFAEVWSLLEQGFANQLSE
ncbi:TetR/AcrR family transcriptional regulator [Gorillibacterium timonense]|uniref:TetR/AcrR family transcriptional regulator n=1 Tax=Gorillibacterium timonense TaxID=1689269 RepID=UPI00071E1586|nr:TetR family transcriptional regulator [Gorillibacterium timonense]